MSNHITTTVNGKRRPEFRAWENMKQRCYNPNYIKPHNYSGRGITVSSRWRNSFQNFYEDMGQRPDGTSLDRIDNDGNYEPSNCRWADIFTQNNNMRRKLNPNKRKPIKRPDPRYGIDCVYECSGVRGTYQVLNNKNGKFNYYGVYKSLDEAISARLFLEYSYK